MERLIEHNHSNFSEIGGKGAPKSVYLQIYSCLIRISFESHNRMEYENIKISHFLHSISPIMSPLPPRLFICKKNSCLIYTSFESPDPNEYNDTKISHFTHSIFPVRRLEDPLRQCFLEYQALVVRKPVSAFLC